MFWYAEIMVKNKQNKTEAECLPLVAKQACQFLFTSTYKIGGQDRFFF